MKQEAFVDTTSLIRYAEGDLAPPDAEELTQKLERDPQARERLVQLQRMIHCIGHVEESPCDMDFAPLVRAAVAADRPRRSTRLMPGLAVGFAACIAAALAFVFIWPPLREVDGTSRAKGTKASGNERAKWTQLSAYVTDGTAPPRALGSRIHLDDALLFSYTNNGDEPFERLMVFAVDSRGSIYWYYPAYLRAEEDPVAIPIESRALNVELKELIRQPMAPGPVSLVGLFTDDAVRVSQIEEIISGLGDSRPFVLDNSFKLPIDNSAQHMIRTQVKP